MAVFNPTYFDYVGDGVTTQFPINFDYILESEVYVNVDDNPVAFSIASGFAVLSPAPEVGAEVRVYRSTDVRDPKHVFQHGSPLLPRPLDENFRQTLYAVEEAVQVAGDALDVSSDANQNAAEALATANRAIQDSAQAAQTANDADQKADQALLESAQAVQTAKDADQKADTAVSTAGAAQTAANSALSIANAIDSKAQTALDNSVDAVGRVGSMEDIVGNLQAGGVSSFNGRVGSVLPTAGDYSVDDITGLGTVATRDVGESSGNVMEVGAFGLGTVSSPSIPTLQQIPMHRSLLGSMVNGVFVGIGSVLGSMLTMSSSSVRGWAMFFAGATPQVFLRQTMDAWDSSTLMEMLHTGNILSATGQSTRYPMTQKAVTNALNTKVGLTGNQTIAGIKTFSSFPVTPSTAPTADYQAANKKYVDDSAIGVGQTWQDLTGSRVERTTYTNTTGRPIMVVISTQIGSSPDGGAAVLAVDGVRVGWVDTESNSDGSISAIVPQGSTYSADKSAGNNLMWAELR